MEPRLLLTSPSIPEILLHDVEAILDDSSRDLPRHSNDLVPDSMSASQSAISTALICVVDDDTDVRNSLSSLLRAVGYSVETFAGPGEFLASDAINSASCLILDIRLGKPTGSNSRRSWLRATPRFR